jgi:exonuclease VII large subunit
MTVFFERAKSVYQDAVAHLNEMFRILLIGYSDSIKRMEQILHQIDPQRVLSRGYSIVKVGSKMITSSSELEIGADVNVQLSRGLFTAGVKKIFK